ncbi:hypothetical protein [Citrobacter sp. Marseille-Q6884]|uniref:hypothetical protein n=1 Tax=Citrobacter sp. Marseille-Q6884 TaxID=2956786 RepID=UPI0021B47372|nr:hypothetical protein [Citrobacter sp. Marseille-Q6884]
MNKKGVILAAWLMFPVSGNLVAAETQVAVSEENRTSPPTISWSELEKRRPPDSFHMVYAEDKPVCKIILDALNEEGYDRRYFNSSPEIYHPLPELLLQTRLNMPRRLLGTHLFRTEEYEIPWVDEKGKPQKDYWYRFIGQGYDTLILATDIEDGYFTKYTESYTDFIQFRRSFFSENLKVWSKRKSAWIYEFESFQDKTKWYEIFKFLNFQAENGDEQKYSQQYWSDISENESVFEELVNLDNQYYLLMTRSYPEQGSRLAIVAYVFNHMHTYMTWAYGNNEARAICLIESRFVLQGE